MANDSEIDDPVAILRRAGVFDAAWFNRRNPDLMASGVDALAHFHAFGWREGRWPNAYFDPDDYRRRYPDVRAGDGDPLLHYVNFGEAEGRRPIAHFDPIWYRVAHHVPANELCLAHFLARRATGQVSPIADFDAAYYLACSPDVAAAGMDPFEHYLVQGAREARRPSADFDPVYYAERYLRGSDANPLLHFIQHRDQAPMQKQPAAATDIPREVRRFTQPGPAFEEVRSLPPGAPRRAMVLAFYLPQFHPIAENDSAWGDGFTEWTNVSRGLPRFAGHYQPRIPRDLGHYRLDAATLRRQAAMASNAGLHGFVFYYYRFGRRRVLEAPLEAWLADPAITMPFCLMWANENWTRRWDGSDHEILIAQEHRAEDDAGLIADLVRHMRDPRYIRLSGRPVLMIYRMDIVPPGAVARWRRMFAAEGEDPLLVMGQTFGAIDPRPHGMDMAVEFPPHKVADRLELAGHLTVLDPGMTTRVHDYQALVEASLAEPAPAYPLIRTAVPHWDNDARRPGAGLALRGSSPAAYQSWLETLIRCADQRRIGGEAVVCVNAWNEWAEGAYLEPDRHFGAAYLNATARAIAGLARPSDAGRLLLVGHDAFPAGAQLILLAIGRQLMRSHGIAVEFLLMSGGALVEQYRAVAPTTVGQDEAAVRAACTAGTRSAIVNSAAAARIIPWLRDAGIASLLLVHELPPTLRRRGLLDDLRAALAIANCTVFPAAHVRERLQDILPLDPARVVVRPQGIYAPSRAGPQRAAELRAQLRLPPNATLLLGVGHGDLRKGFDIFLQVWRALQSGGRAAHLLWVGDIDLHLGNDLGPEIAAAEASGTFHHLGFQPNASDWFAAADALLLPSREDPLPSVVLEAMSAGTPTVAFEEAGGIPDLLRNYRAGASVPLADAAAMARAARQLVRVWTASDRRRLAAAAREAFSFSDYTAELARLALPAAPDISVVVPSCDYARYLPERLHSIFAQTCPVREVVVLDDCSTDGSVEAAQEIADRAGRVIAVETTSRRAGVFAQWRRAAERAGGEWLWIAEADDACEPRFIEALSATLADGVVLAFTDSRAVDADGRPTGPSYKPYYGPGVLHEDADWDGADFVAACLAERNLILNASAVLWRRAALLAALDRCGEELSGYALAGDWRLYVEVLLAPGARVAYVADPLNIHRRHAASVTGRMSPKRHVEEIAAVHRVVAARLRQPGLSTRQRAMRRDTASALVDAARAAGEKSRPRAGG